MSRSSKTFSPEMSRSSKTFSPSKENLLLQHLAKLERSPSVEDCKKFGSQCSINLDHKHLDLPSEPKRRRIMADDSPSSISSQVSSQMSSRSHSPSLSECMLDDSLMSTPNASPTGTLKEHFRRKYRKDELWAAIETNYKYLMDKGIIEACQTTESEGEEASVNSNVSFGEFLQQYKELTSWLKNIQMALQQKRASSLALSEKYLNQSYYEEIQRSPRLTMFNDYAGQLKLCQPILTEEVDVFLREVNTQWSMLEKTVAPTNPDQDPQSMLMDLEDDLECLKQWLDGVESYLRNQNQQDWAYEDLELTLADHKLLQQDIESHSRIVSAILKVSERLQTKKNAVANSLEYDSVDVSAHNLERRWHTVWLQSLEWQCRLEDAITRKTGIYNAGPFSNFTDDEYDTNDVTSSGDDSFHGLGYRGDFIQSPQKSDSSTSLTPDCDKSSGKDSAVASETELKTNSDMSENYQDLSVSTGSDSDREYLRQIKMRNDSKDIGYGSESQSDDLESRYRGITFSGISGKVRKTSKSGDFYATVAVDTTSTDKTDGSNSTNPEAVTCDESDINAQIEQVLRQDESEMEEDIQVLIDQADIMVQQGNTFNKSFSAKPGTDADLHTDVHQDGSQKSLSSSSLSGPQRGMVDKGVGTIESSCDASDEESGSSDAPVEEFSVVTDDGTETIDSVMGSEYTSDEMKNGARDYTNLPKLYDTNSLRNRLKGKSARERPWSVVELPNVAELNHISTSESTMDNYGGAHSDSDITATTSVSKLSLTLSPTFPRHRNRRIQRISSGNSPNSLRSQIGAKRKLNLDVSAVQSGHTMGLDSISIASTSSKADKCQTPTPTSSPVVHSAPSSPLKQISETPTTPVTPKANSETTTLCSGNVTVVPLAESCTSDEEVVTPMPCGNDLISTLQNARFRSSGSSYDDSDTQGDLGGATSEADNNDGSFSENAWDNYQAPLYPTGSEDPPEEALTWEPGEMEFDDEFSLPQSTILATLIARRSEDEGHSGKHLKLVPSSQGNFDDSDSDIEDLHHVLEESRMQLKVADRSLRKKRKDPLKTGLYLNPGKYGELLATIETNIKCLEAINQHLDPAGVSENDIHTIQDLLYQWEKLHALASERRNQSQELKTMYATLLSVEGVALEGVPSVETTRFRSMEQLKDTICSIQERQKLLTCQSQMLADLRGAVANFSAQNPSVSMDGFLDKIDATENKLESLQHSCAHRLAELEHIQCVWHEYVDTRHELEFLLTQEREIIERLAFNQECEIDGYKASVEADLQKLVGSLALYEEKLVALQRLRAELLEVSDDETQLDLTAGLADIRNQLYVAQKQCRDMMAHGKDFPDAALRDLERELDLTKEEEMEIEEYQVQQAVAAKPQTHIPRVEPVKTTPTRARPQAVMRPKELPKAAGWLKTFPLQAIAFAVFLGLLYLFAPGILHRFLDFSLKINPELDYVNGAPPV